MPDTAVWNPQYHQYILATDPIAYWLQDEKQRNVAYDWVRRRQGSDQDGAYTGVDLGRPGIGDGRTSPFFDGANDFNNIWTPTFRDRFELTNHGAPGAVGEGSVMVWATVANVNVWTDGIIRFAYHLRGPTGADQIFVTTGVNQLRHRYRAGAVVNERVYGTTSVDWMMLLTTWSKTLDEVRVYYNGVQQGATINGLGVWSVVLSATHTVVGASDTTPVNAWHGNIAHPAVWGRVLSPAEILQLYKRGVF